MPFIEQVRTAERQNKIVIHANVTDLCGKWLLVDSENARRAGNSSLSKPVFLRRLSGRPPAGLRSETSRHGPIGIDKNIATFSSPWHAAVPTLTMTLRSTASGSLSIFDGGKLKPGIYKVQNLYTQTYMDIHEHSREACCRPATVLEEGRGLVCLL